MKYKDNKDTLMNKEIKKSKKEKKPFYELWWFWVAIALLLIANIGLAYHFREKGANIFTAISGWISGIATIFVGVITVYQVRTHKNETDVLQKGLQEKDEFVRKLALRPEILIFDKAEETQNFYLDDKIPSGWRINPEQQAYTFSIKIVPLNDIINLHCDEIKFEKKNVQMYLSSHAMSTNLIEAKRPVFILMQIPESIKESQKIEFSLIYENIYGMKYKKKDTFLYFVPSDQNGNRRMLYRGNSIVTEAIEI